MLIKELANRRPPQPTHPPVDSPGEEVLPAYSVSQEPAELWSQLTSKFQEFKMRALLLGALVVVLCSGVSRAQFDEICHYECDIIYCDPYTDFCDYDCYEVCYPYRTRSGAASSLPMFGLKAFKSLRLQTAVSSSSVPGAPVQRLHAGGGQRPNMNSDERTGKVVRMRIRRVPKLLSNGARDYSRPENFALFQSCTL